MTHIFWGIIAALYLVMALATRIAGMDAADKRYFSVMAFVALGVFTILLELQ